METISVAVAAAFPDNRSAASSPAAPPSSAAEVVECDHPFMTLVDAAASLLQVTHHHHKTTNNKKVPEVEGPPKKEEATTTKKDRDESGDMSIEGGSSRTHETPLKEDKNTAESGEEKCPTEGDFPAKTSSSSPSPLPTTATSSMSTSSSSSSQVIRKATFPEELMDVLDDEQHQDVLAWMPNGSAFTIVDHKKFVTTKMPALFKIRNMSSFVRKLSRWGFQRVHDATTNNSDVFRHPHFQQGHKAWLSRVKCVSASTAAGLVVPSSPPPNSSPPHKLSLSVPQGTASLGRPSLTPPPTLRKAATPTATSSSKGGAAKNLVSQSSALKKSFKNRAHLLLMTPHHPKKKNGAGTVVHFAAKAAASIPVTPCTPHQEGGGGGSDSGHPLSHSSYYAYMAPTNVSHDEGGGGGTRMPGKGPRYLHPPRLPLPLPPPTANAPMYSTYAMEPSPAMMMTMMPMHHPHDHHHHQASPPSPSVHERLLSVAEDPRLPASLRRRLVSVALDSLRDHLDDHSGRSVITATSASAYPNCHYHHHGMDTSLGRSMSSLSSSTRSSTSTTSSPTSYIASGAATQTRPTLSQTRAAMLHPSSTSSSSSSSSSSGTYGGAGQAGPPPPYLPMSASGPPSSGVPYRHAMRRTDRSSAAGYALPFR